MSRWAAEALPLKRSLRKLRESWRSTEEACEDPGWLLPLRLAKKGQDGWACPGSVGEASWEAPLPIAAGGQLLYLMLRCFAACCC